MPIHILYISPGLDCPCLEVVPKIGKQQFWAVEKQFFKKQPVLYFTTILTPDDAFIHIQFILF